MTNIDFNKLAKIVNENNHKWWIDIYTGKPLNRNKYEMLMLTVTELAEAAEGIRKNLMDDHLPHRKMAEVELADAMIRMLDFAGGFNYNLYSEEINGILNFDITKKASHGYMIPQNHLENLFSLVASLVSLSEAVKEDDRIDIEYGISLFLGGLILFSLHNGYDIMAAVEEKNEYNKTRKDHSIEERLKENGKKV